MKADTSLFRQLPSVDELVRSPAVSALIAENGHVAVADACRAVLGRLRLEISAQQLDEKKLALAVTGIPDAVAAELRRALSYSLRPVINATGVILHTNLGRAPIAEKAIDHIRETAGVYSNLEFDLASGERGRRDIHVDRLFRRLLNDHGPTGTADSTRSASTIVVNNNAAAVLLALNTLAEGGEVIVSRGELVEIGGSFRIPEVMGKSGGILREVGTTNRTRISDYESAITDRTRLLLRVHRSNFEITGFTQQPALADLVELARKHKLPLMEDLGSGALVDLATVGIGGEPGVLDSLRLGVDVVTYSGDKLLGGPQAGLISAREDLIQKMRSNSLFRALRVDKLIYAALEATLLAYVRRDYDALPALRTMHLSKADIAQRAEGLIEDIEKQRGRSRGPANLTAELVDGESLVGGGSAPSAVLATKLVAITHKHLSAEELSSRLRACNPPIIARVEEGRLLLDLRTVFPEQERRVAEALSQL
jgi:L-seryl-tRNA(Ser) seleniumtransferase